MKKTALSRALTEMNQGLCVFGSGDLHDKSALLQEWLKTATIQNQSYLVPNSSIKKHNKDAFSGFDDLKEDILYCQKIVEEKGLEFLVLDQTRPDIGLCAVKVIVPGLRHFWNRFAPGRLYDVPVELGLLPEKLKEEELNPIPMFL